MKKKIFFIVGALVAIGAATGAALYYAYPVQISTLAGLTRNFIISLAAPPRRNHYGIERGLQRCRGCCTSGSRRCYIDGRYCRRLAELQPNTDFGALLAAQRDQCKECRQAEGLVYLRHRWI